MLINSNNPSGLLIKNNDNPVCNAPGTSFTDPEALRAFHNITVRADRYKQC